MQVFKSALAIVFRNPTLLLVYTVALSFMGIAIAWGTVSVSPTGDSYQRESAQIAVIDRDGSEISHSIAAFLSENNELVEVEDESIALQDAVARGKVSYVLIIPEGFGTDFLHAVEADTEEPRMESAYSYYSAEGAVVDTELAGFITALKGHLASLGPSEVPKAITAALATASEKAQAKLVDTNQTVSESERFTFYLKFDIYVFFAAIVACLGTLLSTLNRTDVRRRNLISPLSSTSIGLQTALACLVVTAIVWAWIMLLGCVVFPESVAAIGMQGLAFMALISFCFALICLAVAFLIGQLGLSSMAANAIGNICGLVVSFLGGSWIPLDIAGEGVRTVAHFLPGYWYTDALSQASQMGSSTAAIGPIMGDLGILALYAIAIFCVGMVIGRMRVQTAESGGNAAAALTTP